MILHSHSSIATSCKPKGTIVSVLDELNAAVAQVRNLPRVQFTGALSPQAYSWISRKHADGAVHEPATIAAFIAAAKLCSCKTIFDVGAHLGYFTLLARSLYPQADLTAFEMHPGSVQEMARLVGPGMRWARALGPGVRCVHAAISDVTRSNVTFWISGFNIFEEPEGGWDQLDKQPGAMKERGPGNRGRGFASGDFLRLDDFCAAMRIVPDLIKIDVEGYQAKAVRGAKRVLKHIRPVVIIELHDPEKLARFATTNKETVQPFFDAGYSAYWCGNHRAADAVFEPIVEMGERHEKLSLAVFVPQEA